MSSKSLHATRAAPDRALLIQGAEQRSDEERTQRLAAELSHLARSAGLQVAGVRVFPLSRVVPATWLGSGNVALLGEEVEALAVTVVVFNHPLAPVQQRNLETALQAKVVDRTGLILEIFAARARTREGRLQVELASLLYQQSRLVRSWTHLERQRGGVGLRGGPGESQIEVDRRLIRNRIQELRKSLRQVVRTRALQRSARRDVPFFTVILVGYTNAGKSTLFNRLAGAEVMAADQLFATLDPTLRVVRLPGGSRIILGDTVGFIRDLPHQLVSAFRATLEEVLEADLLLHIVDLSDPEWSDQQASVDQVLSELGAGEKPVLTLFNKADKLTEPGTAERLAVRPRTVVLSAVTGLGEERLFAALETEIAQSTHCYRLDLPAHRGELLARVCREGQVLERQEKGDRIYLKVSFSTVAAGRLRQELIDFADAS